VSAKGNGISKFYAVESTKKDVMLEIQVCKAETTFLLLANKLG
jgi:hypothetical protein